jgi:hypothetical protein
MGSFRSAGRSWLPTDSPTELAKFRPFNSKIYMHATIMRIEQRPDPNFLKIETQEGWQEFLRLRSVFFWVKLDDFPELHDYYKQNEVIFRYRELRPLSPKSKAST